LEQQTSGIELHAIQFDFFISLYFLFHYIFLNCCKDL